MIKKVCKKEISVLLVLYLIVLKYLIKNRESAFTLYLLYLITSFSIQKEIKSQIQSKKTPDNIKKVFDICGKEPINNSKTANLRSGNYYYNARWYDPQLGRFITEDPARANSNWFIYTSNNPLTRIDPTGLKDKALIENVRQGDHSESEMPYTRVVLDIDTIVDGSTDLTTDESGEAGVILTDIAFPEDSGTIPVESENSPILQIEYSKDEDGNTLLQFQGDPDTVIKGFSLKPDEFGGSRIVFDIFGKNKSEQSGRTKGQAVSSILGNVGDYFASRLPGFEGSIGLGVPESMLENFRKINAPKNINDLNL